MPSFSFPFPEFLPMYIRNYFKHQQISFIQILADLLIY